MPKSTPLSNVDAAWLGMEDPTNLMMVSGILMFDESLDFERLKATLKYRLLNYNRFRQRIVTGRGPLSKPRWVDDPTFDLSAHLHRIALPEPGDCAVLQETISDLVSTPLDFSKPLWQFHLLENVNGGSVLVARLHHAIADGIALMHVLLSLADEDPDAPWPSPDDAKRKRRRGGRLFTMIRSAASVAGKTLRVTGKLVHEGMTAWEDPEHAKKLLAQGGNVAASLGRLLLRPPDPKTAFKGKLGVAKRATWSDAIPLADVKAVGKVTGGTVNDVLLTAMTGALRRYLIGRGEVVDNLNFRAAVPVNLRPVSKAYKLGNQFGLVFLSLPVGIADQLERLFELKRRMDALKDSAEPIVVFGALGAVGKTPDEIQEIVVNLLATKSTAVMTNVPGPRQQLYLAGSPIRDLMFWVPQSGRLGLGVSIISYNGKVRLGVITDIGLVPDPDAIAEAFHTEFDQMMDLVRVAEALEGQETEIPPSPEPEPTPHRCQATTKAGNQCKNKALPASDFCRVHQPKG